MSHLGINKYNKIGPWNFHFFSFKGDFGCFRSEIKPNYFSSNFLRERRPARLAGWCQVRLSYNFLSRLTATHFQHNIALHTIRHPPQPFSDHLSPICEGEKKIYRRQSEILCALKLKKFPATGICGNCSCFEDPPFL